MIKKKTGKTITVKLERPYLYDRAIPRILPNCPSYLPSSTSFRKSPNLKKIQKENFDLKRVLNQSIADDLAYKKQNMFHNINDIKDKLNFTGRNYWTSIRKQDNHIICHIIQSPYPKMALFIVIDSDFAAHVFCNDVKIHRIGEYKIPNFVTDINIFEILISNLQKMDIEEQQSKPQNDISILKLIMSFLLLLQEESNKYYSTIKFIY